MNSILFGASDCLPRLSRTKLNRNYKVLDPNDSRCEEYMYYENIIIPFSLLYDMDLATITLASRNYNATKFWDFDSFGEDNTPGYWKLLRTSILLNKSRNPLSIIKENASEEIVDNLYEQMIIKDYGKICGLAAHFSTALLDLALMAVSLDNTEVTILCNGLDSTSLDNKIKKHITTDLKRSNDAYCITQVETLKRMLGSEYKLNINGEIWDDPLGRKEKPKTINVKSGQILGCEDYKDYSTIFYKDIDQVIRDLDYPTETGYAFKKQTVLCANYKYNMDKDRGDVLDLDTALRVGLTNNFGITTIYKKGSVF